MTSLPTQRPDSSAQAPSSVEAEHGAHGVHDRGLLAIAIFKLAKSAFFFGLGMGAVHFLHKDLGDYVLRLARELRFDPESRAVALVLDKVDLIDSHRLKEIGMATFAYSGVALTEGIGLLLERTWAEFLTLILTVSFLPWEMYELVRRPHWARGAIFVINLCVLWYLVWLLRRKGTLGRRTEASR
ncbi:MAG: DUF2127 domain-containing protein [Acidobacteria bacterium]|nr:DUF2127 domain-containing protein [Acidobacteriota bacterium]